VSLDLLVETERFSVYLIEKSGPGARSLSEILLYQARRTQVGRLTAVRRKAVRLVR
jgi:hypothetical protein